MKKLFLLLLVIWSAAPLFAANILFDHTKNETAGNADWVIDNNEPIPSPAQSGIIATTSQNYWTGGISAWGVGLVKLGHTVATLATTDSITYGRVGNPRDLSQFKVFVVCEPQNQFSANEKKAIFNFVRAGGGLFMVADHYLSDRDNDGWDSPKVWDSLGIKDSFGLYFNAAPDGAALNNFSESSRSFNAAANDSVISGPLGHADTLAFHNGTAITLFTANNPTAVSHFWRAANSAASMCASARFGQGKVVGIGDSSPADDSTGQAGNTLYNGWGEGEDSIVFLNATAWLAAGSTAGVGATDLETEPAVFPSGRRPRATAAPNPSNGQAVISYTVPDECGVAIELYAIDGRRVAVFERGRQGAGPQRFTLPAGLAAGTYLYRIRAGAIQLTGMLAIVR